MTDLKNILSDDKGKLPEEKLIAYLEGRLSPEEQHEVEQWLADEGMESDALEGLKNVQPNETKDAVSRINHRLLKELTAKRHKRRKQIVNNPWAIVAIVVIILLVVLAFIVIRMSLHK
jgi:anti-sigma factor RsiW